LSQKGEAILQLAATCHKFLSEEEKLRKYKAIVKKVDLEEEEIKVSIYS
jgi:hypothetical protein